MAQPAKAQAERFIKEVAILQPVSIHYKFYGLCIALKIESYGPRARQSEKLSDRLSNTLGEVGLLGQQPHSVNPVLLGFGFPFSHRLTVANETPNAAANACCDMPS